ncbi:MAG: hypothetical protein WD035_09160 [Balneolaceae bacterium]
MTLNQKTANPPHDGHQGYVYASYGPLKYLKYAIASIVSLRRYDRERPVALVCSTPHRKLLKEKNLANLVDKIVPLDEEHASIVGFKHNVHRYMPFDKNLYLDSDIIWCKNPDSLWTGFSVYDFTITGNQISDHFFGAPKNFGVLTNILFRGRRRTLKRFGLTYLSRVQSGMIYADDPDKTKEVCLLASSILKRQNETHFQSRLKEKGRNEESCEWSLAMAMSTLNLPVYPWLQGQMSPQLDFIEAYTDYDPDFNRVICLYYCDPFVFSFRGLKTGWLRNLFIRTFSFFPGRGDYLKTTPYCLHFGWVHQKQPFYRFAEKTWEELTDNSRTSS